MKWLLAIAALLLALAVWRWQAAGAPGPGDAATQAPDAPAESAAANPARAAAAPSADFDPPSAPTPQPQPQPAWQTMAQAREHGDGRAPPIERPAPESLAPAATAWDLSDPARYREYELRGQRRLREEYLIAADQELPKWKALLAQARANGAPAQAIAEAEEKIRRLETRQALLRSAPAPGSDPRQSGMQ